MRQWQVNVPCQKSLPRGFTQYHQLTPSLSVSVGGRGGGGGAKAGEVPYRTSGAACAHDFVPCCTL